MGCAKGPALVAVLSVVVSNATCIVVSYGVGVAFWAPVAVAVVVAADISVLIVATGVVVAGVA